MYMYSVAMMDFGQYTTIVDYIGHLSAILNPSQTALYKLCCAFSLWDRYKMAYG